MPLYTADALILRTYKLGEADRIVVFLTSDRGKRRGVAKGARRSRSPFTGGLEPFTQVRLAYFERENRDLVRLSYVDPVASPFVSSREEVLSHASYFAELVDAWALEGDPSERLYRLGVSTIEAIANDVQIERVARYFEYWILRIQGVYPSIVTCHECGGALDRNGAVLLPQASVLVCRECGAGVGGLSLSVDALAFLRSATRQPAVALGDVALDTGALRQLSAVHGRLIVTHLDREPKSVRVLKETGATSPALSTTGLGPS